MADVRRDDDGAAPAAGAGIGRSARKQHAILEASRTVFLEQGFAGASMDQVAALARVSKQTVYKHFASKKALFEAVIIDDISATETLTHDMVAGLGRSTDLEEDLRRFARRHVVDVTQPHLLRLRRLIVAEADRFPELAETWYAAGPARAHTVLAEQLEQLTERGLLRVDDPLLVAEQFNWLILSAPLNRAMFHPGDELSEPELERYADAAVRTFLAAYRHQPNDGG
ncbi:TetR/AcrR family transcriptional regulator [Georgenia sp. TF02-10]|uniref:TetR/AcrR family transcriptional regulator n=1 Tax=Georgenia sp. TF02-10 TaxID=2917725 RepID=UPI001FA6BFFB|nr:TetR/AcrR family transcriptional regulator [Georgenia sp. TF02-10]UNX56226.1 TetR/AcrR family transcriptional regulator [Georgenia sp. TF02-10]